jgi:archaeoflavoprotein AfpA
MAVEKLKMDKGQKKIRSAWGITGSGDRIAETIEVMEKIQRKYRNETRITIYASKAADQVLKFYGLFKGLKENFSKIRLEVNANNPTLAVQLQSGKIEFLLIAPATSNTVAKLSNGIADTLLTNAAIMALKAFVPVYVMPCDYKQGIKVTQLPDGNEMKIRVRKEDVEQTKKLAAIEGVFILEKPEEIYHVFKKHFKLEK